MTNLNPSHTISEGQNKVLPSVSWSPKQQEEWINMMIKKLEDRLLKSQDVFKGLYSSTTPYIRSNHQNIEFQQYAQLFLSPSKIRKQTIQGI